MTLNFYHTARYGFHDWIVYCTVLFTYNNYQTGLNLQTVKRRLYIDMINEVVKSLSYLIVAQSEGEGAGHTGLPAHKLHSQEGAARAPGNAAIDWLTMYCLSKNKKSRPNLYNKYINDIQMGQKFLNIQYDV